MAGQENHDVKDFHGNVIQYEFQGNLVPLEKAFEGARKLFKRYVKEIMQAEGVTKKSQLSPDAKFKTKEIENYLKQLEEYSKRHFINDDDIKNSKRLFRKIKARTNDLEKLRDKTVHSAEREASREEKRQRREIDYTSIASQFKAQTQSEQLNILMRELPELDPKVINDINSYVEAWRRAKQEFSMGTASAEELATATEELDQKAREYIPTLTKMKQQQKGANTALESMAYRIASCVTSLEYWINKIKQGIELLGDYIESVNFLDVSIGAIDWSSFTSGVDKATESITKFEEALEQARWSLGLDATSLNTAAATFIAFANSSSIASKDVLDFSQNMTQISIDMASLYNKDVDVMMTALRSALAGNTRSMMNYGISVHDATLEEWLLTKGIDRSMSSLSESSQVLVRYAYIMEQTSAAQGDMAKTLKSPSNQLKILKNQVSLLIQNLGALFNVIIYPMMRTFNAVLIPLNAFVSALTALATEDYSASIGSVTDAADDATDALDSASNAAVGLTDLDEINVSSTSSSNNTGIDSAIQSLIDGLEVYKGFSSTTTKLTELMQSLGNALAPIWEMFSNTNALNNVISMFDNLLNVLNPIKNVLDTIRSGYDNLPGWLQSVFNVLGSVTGAITSLAVALLTVNALLAVFKTMAGLGIWKNFIASLTSMWSAFLLIGQEIYAAIASLISWIATTIKARLEAIKTTIANEGFAVALKKVALGALSAVAALIKYIAKLVASAAKAVFATIKNLLLSKSLWGVALGTIAAAGLGALAVAGVVGAAVAIGKAAQSRSNESTNELAAGLASARGFATGGIVSKPTFAMIGEGKYNEAVVPLGNSPQFTSMKESIADTVVNKQKSTSTNNSNVFNGLGSQSVVLNLDGRTLGRMQLNSMNKVRRQVGVDLK